MKPAKLARAALIVALAAGLALAFANRGAFSQDALQQWLATAGWWAPIAFVALYAAGTVLFLPGSVLTLAAGALFGIVPGTLYSLAGLALVALASVTTACATAAPPSSQQPQAQAPIPIETLPRDTPLTGCDVTVSFGSYAEGVSDPTHIVGVLQNDRRVRHLSRVPWGREGETNYCVRTGAPAEARSLATALRPLVRGPRDRRSFVVIMLGPREVARTPPPAR